MNDFQEYFCTRHPSPDLLELAILGMKHIGLQISFQSVQLSSGRYFLSARQAMETLLIQPDQPLPEIPIL